jgi:hypothetical protein
MAFEIMQYASGEASKYGGQAAQALQSGDVANGTKLVARALNEVPDGYDVKAGPNGEMIYTNAKGKIISQNVMSPQQLLNTALGLSNRSAYWKILSERGAMVPAAAKAANADERSVSRAARLETEKLKQARLRQQISKGNAPKGGGGPVSSPVADALADIRSRMPARGGVPQGAGEAEGGAPQVNGGDGAHDENDDDDDDEPVVPQGAGEVNGAVPQRATEMTVPQGGGEMGGMSGDGSPPRPVDAPGPNSIKPAPASALRTKPAKANQGTFQLAKPAAPTGSPPISTSPARPGAVPTGNEGRGGEPRTINQTAPVDEMRSEAGGASAPAVLPDQESEDKFDEPHPLSGFGGRDPYADLIAGINPKTGKADPAITQYWATKQGRAERSNIIAEQRSLNNDVKAWESRKKAFEKKQAADSKGGKGVKPRDVISTDTLSTNIMTGAGGIKERIDDTSKPSVFNDKRTDPKELHDLAMDIVTNNPNVPTGRALDYLGTFTQEGTEDSERGLRGYDVLGYADKSKSQVVISPRGNQSVKIKMSKDAFERLHGVVDKRWQTRGKVKEQGSWGKVGEAVNAAANATPHLLTPFVKIR